MANRPNYYKLVSDIRAQCFKELEGKSELQVLRILSEYVAEKHQVDKRYKATYKRFREKRWAGELKGVDWKTILEEKTKPLADQKWHLERLEEFASEFHQKRFVEVTCT